MKLLERIIIKMDQKTEETEMNKIDFDLLKDYHKLHEELKKLGFKFTKVEKTDWGFEVEVEV